MSTSFERSIILSDAACVVVITYLLGTSLLHHRFGLGEATPCLAGASNGLSGRSPQRLLTSEVVGALGKVGGEVR